MQKKSPLYKENKEETVWSMDRFNNYVNENYCNENNDKVPLNWVNTILKVSLLFYIVFILFWLILFY